MQNVWIPTVHTFVVVKLASTGMERHVKVSNHNSNGERSFVYCFVILSSYFMSSICYFLDIDECLNNPCHHNASCTDNEGSFYCQCNVGFSGDGVNCTSKISSLTSGFLVIKFFLPFFQYFIFLDIDECLNNQCHHNASCTDNEGSFDCQCNVGFSGDGVNCTSKACFFTLSFLVITLFLPSFVLMFYISRY